VRNDAGEIYRTVKAEGIDSFLAAVTIFQNLGMVNELQSLTGVQDGFNAIFQPPGAIQASNRPVAQAGRAQAAINTIAP
jgi:hypothetical protein